MRIGLTDIFVRGIDGRGKLGEENQLEQFLAAVYIPLPAFLRDTFAPLTIRRSFHDVVAEVTFRHSVLSIRCLELLPYPSREHTKAGYIIGEAVRVLEQAV